jgi:hypothetical protein
MVHCTNFMTVESEVLETREQPPLQEPVFAALRSQVAEVLKRQARGIAKGWERRAWSVARHDSPDGAMLTHRNRAEAIVKSLAISVASGGAGSEGMIPLGLACGTEAFEAGVSLHQMLKGLDLLSAMVLYGVETALTGEVAADLRDLGPADTLRLARCLQQSMSLVSLAAAKGYTQAASSRIRANFRHLRHELRNPLGTIKSVLALMEDETIPIDERANPRFRAMARRNARLLGELIADRLNDSAVVSPLLTYQNISLRTVVCAIRRDLRGQAAVRSATILVAGTKARVRVDAVGLELMLHELLRVTLQEASEGDEISIDFGEGTAVDHAIVRIQSMPARPPIADHTSLERLTTLATQLGMKLETKDRLILSLPAHPLESSTTRTELKRLDFGQSHHNVRSTRQRENGQSSSF